MINELFGKNKTVFSLEVFPPKKTDDVHLIYKAIDEMKVCNPDYISVTYGAGGGTNKETIAIASYIQNECNIKALAHLTCAALTEDDLNAFVDKMKENGLKNVLALRGDKPRDMTEEQFEARKFRYASDLVLKLRGNDFCIAGACYPEKHPDAVSFKADLENLKIKVESGVSFLTTQMFFDNQKLYRFLDQKEKMGINVPVTAGIMPITTIRQVMTMIDISDASIPAELVRRIDKYRDIPEDLKKAGIEFAIMQKEDLLKHGVDGIHLSAMNKPEIAKEFFGC